MMRANSKLLAWAGVGLTIGIAAIAAALYIGGPAKTDPGIKVWDASDGKKEP